MKRSSVTVNLNKHGVTEISVSKAIVRLWTKSASWMRVVGIG